MKPYGWIISSFSKGALAGILVAILCLAFEALYPAGIIDNLTFLLSPLYILGFSDDITSWAELYVITMFGNAFLYGLLFAALRGIWIIIRRAALTLHAVRDHE